MTTVLCILFTLSVLAPVYTYVIYPLVLMLFKAREYRTDVSFKPYISVVIVDRSFDGSDGSASSSLVEKKLENISASDYPADALDVSVDHSISEQNECDSTVDGEIVLFTDTETELDKRAITNLVSRFADDRIGCVCSQLRKKLDKDGKATDGVFWMYENKVKQFESRVGRLSGGNKGLYAVRKSILWVIGNDIISLDFYI